MQTLSRNGRSTVPLALKISEPVYVASFEVGFLDLKRVGMRQSESLFCDLAPDVSYDVADHFHIRGSLSITRHRIIVKSCIFLATPCAAT
jgi:hypothetical protein